jgi:hypothetical protein
MNPQLAFCQMLWLTLIAAQMNAAFAKDAEQWGRVI